MRLSSLLLISAASISSAFVLPASLNAAEPNQNTYELLRLFGDVFEKVRSDYVEEPKDDELVEAAINGMLSSLDPHSSYLSKKDFQEMQVQTKGEFGGLGIEVTMESGLVKVVSPIDDTPAAKAGIKPGDFITYIDDEAVMGMTLSEAVEKMRGKRGTSVKLTVLRESETEPLELTIVRDVITIKSVRSHAEGNIGYVRITSFTENTTDMLRSAVKSLQKEIPDMRGMVLDLRNNPGGLLDQAVSVSDAFLPRGEIVSTRERDPKNTKRFSASSGDEVIPVSLPIVVLINNGSASASEIVSGALQDHKRAVVLGTQSFGKGSVQNVIPIPEHGAIRLTTARYYTPAGTSIQAKGITPDIVVEQAKIEPIKNDKVRLEADLRRRLQNLQSEKDKEQAAKPKDKTKEVTPEVKEEDPKKGAKAKEAAELLADDDETKQDFQLQRALDLIRALHVYSAEVTAKK
jgi:carboxyl-terminal processing protease